MFPILQKIYLAFFKKDFVDTVKLQSVPKTKRYEIKERIGAGAFGNVFKAFDCILKRSVAFKMISTENEESASRAEKEAMILAQLSSPHIPSIYDINIEEKSINIIFEWIDGCNLKDQLEKDGTLSIQDVLVYFKDICNALSHSHSHNIYHRDIKPANIIIRQDNKSAVLVDFGIAITPNRTNRLTQTGMAIGTLPYMSPEQRSGGEIDQTSDIYSLSIVLYECLAGNLPDLSAYISLQEIDPGIPVGIDEVIKQGTAADPSCRIQTAEEFYNRLHKCLNQNPSSAQDILLQGSISDIIKYIQNMSPADFSALTEGQKELLSAKVKDLIKKDIYKMRNTIAALLNSIIRVIHCEENCEYYIVQSLKYAFLVNYSTKWYGNPELRETLIAFALKASSKNLEYLINEVRNIIKEVSKIPQHMQSPSYEKIKKILESALARQSGCPNSSEIKMVLEEVNERLRNGNIVVTGF